ncbi:hypothetical protein SAMN05192575_101962 [Nocardioides alpinus]|uniref:PQQ-like domain-containing protein n=1 Tax=Nocardioides alpinus TaxID=748909 RepID=A0A1I0WHC8_9ACTN|nr:hypothetical protein [Nocardioides alpinus]PKH37890.1 hypothetical protein CXG46_21130 [Nocardioides alpinus]SFA87346.1 hypothetical protein SAMN05192575_101962 [Nocardioides alpinus]
MVWLVGVLLLLWLAWGPVVLLLAAAALCVPRVRWWVQDRAHVSRRTAGWITGACVAVVLSILAVPDGWLPIPPAPGAWSGPGYVGRPAVERIPAASGATTNPHLAPASSTRVGPLGLQPEVETSWLGLQRCGHLELTSADRLVGLCTDRTGPSLRLVDPDSMRPTATRVLPDTAGDCAGDAFHLDSADRAVVATTDRRVLAVRTTAAKGAAELAVDDTWDLKPYVPFGDCLVALTQDWAGRLWWVSRDGLVGTIATDTGEVRVIDVGEDVRRDLVADEGGVYVVTDAALHRFTAGPDGTPQAAWRTAYDGTSGSAPVLVDGGAVAITDSADGRLGVLFVAREGGAVICRQPVFGKDEGSTHSDLASLGAGVVVTNNHGYTSPRSTVLGFASDPGIARVDLLDGTCVERWTSDAVSPGAGVTASRPQGLLYAWTKRPSLLGVSAWYLTSLDAETGRSMWSVRTGTGLLAGSDDSQVMLGAGGTAWLGTLAGLVRVRDRD